MNLGIRMITFEGYEDDLYLERVAARNVGLLGRVRDMVTIWILRTHCTEW